LIEFLYTGEKLMEKTYRSLKIPTPKRWIVFENYWNRDGFRRIYVKYRSNPAPGE